MKKFNHVISIQVSVDSIASKLLGMMKEDEKHAELVVEGIVGTLMHKERLSPLYNAMSGHTSEVNFEIGDMIDCTDTVFDRKNDKDSSSRRTLGTVKVIGIDIYRDNPITVEYLEYLRDEETKISKKMVVLRDCSKKAMEPGIKVLGKIDLDK
jgi:hypothetical protein